jgi:flavin reductase (DIM6/NTAB) family NADH-FMN oxidoreductase RutF
MKKIKNFFFKLWFKFTAAEYMRTAYLHPRSVVLLTSSFQGKSNVMPIDWHIPLSYSPKLYAVSLGKKNYSTELIQKSGCFVVNFMSAEFEKEILAAGRVSGVAADKFSLTGLRAVRAKTLDCPKLSDAFGTLECKVINTVDAGDHILFIAKVLHQDASGFSKKQLYHVTRNESLCTIK